MGTAHETMQSSTASLGRRAASWPAAPDLVRAPTGPGHAVQFYDSEHFLATAVADYLATALVAGEPLIAIATEPHRKAITQRLKSNGFDIARACLSGQATLLDVRETLATFMLGSTPDRRRFRNVIGDAIERSQRGQHQVPVRMFGEMVDILWSAGNRAGAIRLEELWNELARTHTFTLLCGYSMAGFDHEADGEAFRDVCQQHLHVVPTERYTKLEDDARLREISRLQQRARALETEVKHRKELEAELHQMRAEAEAANHAKSEFLAVMSHELRTPLNAIGGYTELLSMGLRGPITEAQREDLARIQRSQHHLLTMINDILNFSRIEAGHVEFEISDVTVAHVLSEIAELIVPQAHAKQIHFEQVCCAGDVVVRADREKLKQIMTNLLSNAIKFTASGGTVTLGCEADDVSVGLRVSDTGRGIAPEKLERIFEPFVQLAAGHRGAADGVGLGLSISRNLAHHMGGEIVVTSEVGVGSVFTVRLPRAAGSAPAARQRPQRVERGG